MAIRSLRSHRSGEGRSRWRILILGIFLSAIVWWGYQKFINMSLSKGNSALAAGELVRAEKYFQRVSNLPLTKGRGRDALGAIALLRDDRETAKNHFQAVLEKHSSKWGGDPVTVLEAFKATGKYQLGSLYREFLTQWREEKDLKPIYANFADLALGAREADHAKTYFDKADPKAPGYEALRQQIDTILRQGFIPMVVDRHGAPVIIHDLETDAPAYVSKTLFGGWPSLTDQEGFMKRWEQVDWQTKVQTTLDINLQKAAHQAFADYDGTMVLMDPKNGDILAAYGTPGLDPFSQSFEPGSVIKILTLGSILKADPDLSQYAPKKYPSSMTIGGKIFYDWTTQGMLGSVEEGMAVSCNLMFAQMGIDLGWPKLSKDLKLLFDRMLDPKLVPPWASVGHVSHDPEGAYALGRFAIGLDMMASTSLGVALIPGAIANKGVLPHPRLVLGYLNNQNALIQTSQQADLGALFQPEHLDMLKASMVAAVENPRGTARRAKVNFVDAAIKTGTSGDRPFDSVMVGMLPADNPKIVFGFYLKSGGKAEINGGRVAKNLQEQIKALAPDYLD